MKENVATDIPSGRIPALAEGVQDADLVILERHVLTPDKSYVLVEPGSAAGYVLHPNLEAIADLAQGIFGEETLDSSTP